MPFYNGQLVSSNPQTYISSRLYSAPTIKTCHNTYGGVYAGQPSEPSLNSTVMDIFTLYRNGFYYSTGTSETNEAFLYSNLVGVWDCDDDGNIVIDYVTFDYKSNAPNSTERIGFGRVQQKCNKMTSQCNGTFDISTTTKLERPVNGTFPTTIFLTNGSEILNKIQTNV